MTTVTWSSESVELPSLLAELMHDLIDENTLESTCQAIGFTLERVQTSRVESWQFFGMVASAFGYGVNLSVSPSQIHSELFPIREFSRPPRVKTLREMSLVDRIRQTRHGAATLDGMRLFLNAEDIAYRVFVHSHFSELFVNQTDLTTLVTEDRTDLDVLVMERILRTAGLGLTIEIYPNSTEKE